MRTIRHHLVSLLIFAVLTAVTNSAVADDAEIERRAEKLLQEMTLQEKLGQLNQFSHGQATGPGTGRDDYGEMIGKGLIGSILNASGPRQTNELQRIAMERSRLKIPILFGLDVIHGYWTTFPIPLALSATWDPALVERASAVAAREAASDGIRWTFSPMVDIARDARWGRIAEGAGEDPFLGSSFAQAYVRGYQGKHLSDAHSIVACAKHYVGYGAAEGGRDYNSTEISERTLREIYLPPFKASVDAGALTFMSAFNAINGVPASANARTLDEILREEWGFRGFVVSDWTSVKELIAHGIARDGAHAARRAIIAGVDMDMEGGLYLNDLAAEIESRRLPLEVVDRAVLRVLRVKLALGLFEHPYTEERSGDPVLAPRDIELSRTAAEQSFVLLKNGDASGAAPLPLSAATKTISLIGPLADAPGDMLGCWPAKGDAKNAVSLRASLAEYAKARQIELLYEKGIENTEGTEQLMQGAVAAAQRSDIVLLALGESARITGEAASRTDIGLPGLQGQLFDAVAKAGKPIILVVFSGRPLALAPYVERAAAIVQAWHPGIQGGPALVRVLSGEANFSGRLTVSMPRSVGQLPLYYNHLNTGRPAADVDLSRPAKDGEEKFISRYIDQQNTPLYPFGYGLSYTQLQYAKPILSTPSLSANAVNDNSQKVKVTSEVRNTGTRDGVAVAQLYIRQRGTSVARPVRELKGFQRVELRPGESRQIEFTLGKEELSFWNSSMRKAAEPATVTVWAAKDAQSGEGTDLVITD